MTITVTLQPNDRKIWLSKEIRFVITRMVTVHFA